MSEPNIDPIPMKRVDFSPYTYQKLLRNLKHIWTSIEYHHWAYYARREGKSEKEIKELETKFQIVKKEVETKIDLLLERVNTRIANADKGAKDFDYTITCHSVGNNFSLEEHLKHLQPAVAFKKVFQDPRNSKGKYSQYS